MIKKNDKKPIRRDNWMWGKDAPRRIGELCFNRDFFWIHPEVVLILKL